MAIAALLGVRPANADVTAYAPVDQATIRPGSMLFSEVGQCTANFVFTNGDDVFIGQAAHCTGLNASNDLDGCTADTLPIGSPVEIEGAQYPGRLAYSSWNTMTGRGETDTDTCYANDFALVEIDPRDVAAVNPTMPHWGGPVGLSDDELPLFSRANGYGNSALRQGVRALSPKKVISLGTEESGWSHVVYAFTPGVPGDSGSGLMTVGGEAIGVLSTIEATPRPASNRYISLAKALAYLNNHAPELGGVRLVTGTEPFNTNRLPLGVPLTLGDSITVGPTP